MVKVYGEITWSKERRKESMLNWAIIFFVVAIVAGLLGFTRIAGSSMQIAKILFFIFIIIAVVTFIFGRA